jgi:Mrp family chromosome partitioning ATPase
MRQFLLEATEQFDWVVIDTPPVALLTDANLLSAMIDVALLVVSARTTPYPLVRRAIEAIGAERVLGVVLNRADGADAVPGYYYSYGYSYGASRPADRRWWQPRLRRRRSA